MAKSNPFYHVVLKTNPSTFKIKDLNREKIIVSIYEKELVLSKLYISYYPKPESHIRNKVRVELQLVKLWNQERNRPYYRR